MKLTASRQQAKFPSSMSFCFLFNVLKIIGVVDILVLPGTEGPKAEGNE